MYYILTEEQFAFMQRYHEIIEYSMFSYLISGHDYIDEITSWPEWKLLFRHMCWDDVYDRYEDTPGYDRSFALMLREWLSENPQLIRMPPPRKLISSSEGIDMNIDEDLTGVEMLIRLRDQQKSLRQSDPDEN